MCLTEQKRTNDCKKNINLLLYSLLLITSESLRRIDDISANFLKVYQDMWWEGGVHIYRRKSLRFLSLSWFAREGILGLISISFIKADLISGSYDLDGQWTWARAWMRLSSKAIICFTIIWRQRESRKKVKQKETKPTRIVLVINYFLILNKRHNGNTVQKPHSISA